jgi:hypothetical protein
MRIFFDQTNFSTERNNSVEKASASMVCNKHEADSLSFQFKTIRKQQMIRVLVCVGRPGGGAFAGT